MKIDYQYQVEPDSMVYTLGDVSNSVAPSSNAYATAFGAANKNVASPNDMYFLAATENANVQQKIPYSLQMNPTQDKSFNYQLLIFPAILIGLYFYASKKD